MEEIFTIKLKHDDDYYDNRSIFNAHRDGPKLAEILDKVLSKVGKLRDGTDDDYVNTIIGEIFDVAEIVDLDEYIN